MRVPPQDVKHRPHDACSPDPMSWPGRPQHPPLAPDRPVGVGLVRALPTAQVLSAGSRRRKVQHYRSVISDIFDGSILSLVQCLTCDRVSAWGERDMPALSGPAVLTGILTGILTGLHLMPLPFCRGRAWPSDFHVQGLGSRPSALQLPSGSWNVGCRALEGGNPS